jgi:hypothetical protein
MKPTPAITLGARPMRRQRPPNSPLNDWWYSPGSAAQRAAHLDDAGLRLVEADAPVPAVAAHVHEPAAAIDPSLHAVPHRRRVVFGMRAGDHDAVVGEEVVAFLV